MTPGVRDFLVTFGARIGGILIALANHSMLAWFLGPAGVGSYAACTLFTTMLLIICVLGCDVAAVYLVASKRVSLSGGISSMLVHGGLGCLLAMGVGLVLMQFPLTFLDKASPSEFHLALLAIPLSFFASTLMLLLGALREFSLMAVLSLATTLIQLGWVALFVVVVGWGVWGALLALLISNAITIVWLTVLYRRRFQAELVQPTAASLKEMLSFGVRYYFGKISNQVNAHIGAIILAFFATRGELGLFTVATVMASKIQMIPDTLSTILMPRVAVDAGGRSALVAQSARVVTVVCGALLGVLAIFATPIVRILFSPDFLEAVPLYRIVCLGIFVRVATKLFVPYLLGTDRPGIASWAVAIGMATNIVALYLLMPVMGLRGAAWAMTLGYFASSTILLVSFVRFSGLGFYGTWRFRLSDWAMLGQTIRSVRSRFMPAVQGEI